MTNSFLRLNMGTVCVCGGDVSVYTCIYMNLCAAFSWVFDHWPQSDRSNIADCMTYKAWKSHIQGY